MHRLTVFSLDRPGIVLVILLLATAALAAGLPQVRPAYGYRVLIGDDHPAIVTLDGFIERFGGGLPVHISWKCGVGHPCSSALDETSIMMAHSLERELAVAQGIHQVIGVASAPLLVPAADGFSIRRLVENGEIPPDVDDLARRALGDPFWNGEFVSGDGSVGVVIVQPVDTKAETDELTFEAIAKALRPFEERGFVFYQTGQAAGNIISGRDLANSTGALVPFTVLVIGLVLFALSRSVFYTLAALVTMGVAVLWAVGTMGHLGWPQDGIHEVLIPLILVIGICDSIHLLSRYAADLRADDGASAKAERIVSLVRASREVGGACVITSLTTAAAFLSFTTSALDTFVRFGSIAAIGVMTCLLLTFTLLPIIVHWLPWQSQRADSASEVWEAVLEGVADFGTRRATSILIAAAVLFAVCTYGWVAFLRVDNDWNESLGEDSFVTQSVRFVESNLGPARRLEIELALPSGTQLEDPQSLGVISELSDRLELIEGLGRARSVVDFLSQLNRLLHEDDPAFERVGDTVGANAELLELVSFDNAKILGSWVSLDRSRARISVEAPERSQAQIAVAMDELERIARDVVPETWGLELSGFVAINNFWVQDVQATQLRSFPTALAIVLLLVGVFLRSFRLALATLVPTVLPVVVTLGTMGWMGLSLDVGRAMIATVMLGIAVDDSVHILMQYQILGKTGLSSSEAIRGAIAHTGRAVVTTSLALSLGFLTLMASAWQSISSFGFFISLGIFGALVASLLVLPASMFAFERDANRRA